MPGVTWGHGNMRGIMRGRKHKETGRSPTSLTQTERGAWQPDANTWKIMFWKVKSRTVSHNDEKAKHSDTKQKKHLPYTIMFIINSLCISFTKVLETLLGYFGPLTWIIGADYLAAHPWWNLPFLSQDQESSEQLTHFCCPFLVSLCKLHPQCPVLS